jgi:hypothetical protein
VLLVGEQFGEVLMIDAGVLRAHEAKDAGAHLGGRPPRRGVSAVAVNQRRRPRVS